MLRRTSLPHKGARLSAVRYAGPASGLEPRELGADSVAAAALFERHSAHVFRYCNSRLRKREDAEDAVQTTFLYAVRSLRRGVEPLVESAWLLGIARNVCLARWEAAGRRNRLEAVCDPQELDRSTAAPQGRRDELIGLEDALARLSEQQRRAVLLRDWRGLSYDEVAEQLGVSRAAVETLIFRGRGRLAELLRDEPSTIRGRLASLGNLGSLLNAVKTGFTGGATATNVAATVTVIAVSSAGIVAVPLLDGGARAPAGPLPSLSVRAPTASAAAPALADVRAAPSSAASSAPAPNGPARRVDAMPPVHRANLPAVTAPDTSAATAAEPVAPAPLPAAEPRVTTPAVAGPAPAPATKLEPSAPPLPLVDTPPAPTLLSPVTTVVDDVVTALVPAVPELPVVGPVAETAVETTVDVVGSLPVLPVLPVELQEAVPDLLPVGVVPPLLP